MRRLLSLAVRETLIAFDFYASMTLNGQFKTELQRRTSRRHDGCSVSFFQVLRCCDLHGRCAPKAFARATTGTTKAFSIHVVTAVCFCTSYPNCATCCEQMALERMGIKVGPSVAMIGDTVDDIHAAKAAGCVPRLLRWFIRYFFTAYLRHVVQVYWSRCRRPSIFRFRVITTQGEATLTGMHELERVVFLLYISHATLSIRVWTGCRSATGCPP